MWSSIFIICENDHLFFSIANFYFAVNLDPAVARDLFCLADSPDDQAKWTNRLTKVIKQKGFTANDANKTSPRFEITKLFSVSGVWKLFIFQHEYPRLSADVFLQVRLANQPESRHPSRQPVLRIAALPDVK